MQFVMGDILGFGMVGFMYYNTTGYPISRLIFFVVLILAVIGLIALFGKLFTGGLFKRRQKETDGEYWLRTGKVKKR